jgi:hypothetical protein
VVPPVPWRRLAIGGAVALVALGLIAAFAIPRIESSKDEAAKREERELAERRAARRRRLVADQRAVRGQVPGLRSRRALVKALEGAITAEARRRAAAGELRGMIVRTECAPAPARRDVYDCVAVTRDIPGRGGGPGGRLGYSFRAVVDREPSAFVFCKTNPAAGEAGAPDPRDVVPLSRACRP